MRMPPNETADKELGSSSPREKSRGEPVRRCILSGDRAPQAMLVRLALSPDGDVLPDVHGRAPGRGAWIGVDRATLETAIEKGKLKGALARAFKTGPIVVPNDLAERIETNLRQAVLDRLGLEARASNLVTGSEKIDSAARSGAVSLLLHSSDAREDGRRKLDQAWRVGMDNEGSGVNGTILPVDRTALSMALGRGQAVHVALLGEAAAARVQSHLARWLYFNGCTNAVAFSRDVDGASPKIETLKD